ncbi:MAG: hypothetical protein LBG77_00415 [Dysgonamonadaceae bacterium]|jgi:uncharacterized protein (TIGR02145 family)|nr:hypothetical protein [Dysgonamonadaceae bacterium]
MKHFNLRNLATIVACHVVMSIFPACEPSNSEDNSSEVALSKTELEFGAIGGTETVSVASKKAWTATVSGEVDWVTIDPVVGIDKDDVTVTVAANTSEDERSAIVTFVTKSDTKTLKITQEGGEMIADGTMINGVVWARRNVDAPGTFAATPESVGMLYQWNRKVAYPATNSVSNWDSSLPSGTEWTKANDPSPAGWRIPTLNELILLLDTDKVTNRWTTQNGVSGRKFTDKATGASIFLPAAGCRYFSDGTLYDEGSYGCYWSSSGGAYNLGFNSGYADWGDGGRNDGLSVRPVAE